MTRALANLQRIAAARCERAERRRVEANRAAAQREALRAAAERARAQAEQVQQEAVAALANDPASEHVLFWRQIARERSIQAAEALRQENSALAEARALAAAARQQHERREQQARVVAGQLITQRRERQLQGEEAEDDERIRCLRSVFTPGETR